MNGDVIIPDKETVDMDELISKMAVIEAIEKARANVGHNLERSIGKSIIEILDEVGRDIDRLPPAEPKRGKWIHNGSQFKNRWICSECGYMYYLQKPNFCPNCGADMRGERNEP